MDISNFLYLIQVPEMTDVSEKINPDIHDSWKKILKEEFNTPSFLSLRKFLQKEKAGYEIYPPGNKIFEAFNRTPFDKVKCVIIGQDPYHGPGQAHGLCFSVSKGIKIPPSLQNIYKELKQDLNIDPPKNGDLSKWADQGVLLLNATLTVRARTPGSHQNKGWEHFTDQVILKLSEERQHLVFLLWGRYAQAKSGLIDPTSHLILKAAHPSPFSAHNGFFGCRHFSKTNAYLKKHGIEPINWDLNQ